MLLKFCIIVAYGKLKLLIKSDKIKLKQKLFIEKKLDCVYKEFKRILEYKEVIRSLAAGSNEGNKGAYKNKKSTQEHLLDF